MGRWRAAVCRAGKRSRHRTRWSPPGRGARGSIIGSGNISFANQFTAEGAENAEKSKCRSLDSRSPRLALARDDILRKGRLNAGLKACSTPPLTDACARARRPCLHKQLLLHRFGHQELLMYLIVLQVLRCKRIVLAAVLRELCRIVLAEHGHQLDHRSSGALDHA